MRETFEGFDLVVVPGLKQVLMPPEAKATLEWRIERVPVEVGVTKPGYWETQAEARAKALQATPAKPGSSPETATAPEPVVCLRASSSVSGNGSQCVHPECVEFAKLDTYKQVKIAQPSSSAPPAADIASQAGCRAGLPSDIAGGTKHSVPLTGEGLYRLVRGTPDHVPVIGVTKDWDGAAAAINRRFLGGEDE